MTTATMILLLFVCFATALHVLSGVLAAWRCRPRQAPASPAPANLPRISILRPVCGLDACDHITLASGFDLDWPDYELVFCAAHADDPVVGFVRRLIAANPQCEARLLIGDERPTSNPKLNNLVKGWNAATADWIVMADSNVLLPRDSLQRLLSAWRADTGLVCSPPIGCWPGNVWAELECAFLNGYQGRWQFAADALGFGFAQGKIMMMRKGLLTPLGGISALGLEIAEDAAATKIVRASGLRVGLVGGGFEQPLGPRSAQAVWSRQTRWSLLRRVTFQLYFVPEVLSGFLPPLVAMLIASASTDGPPAETALVLGAVWYGAEALLTFACGWHFSRWSLPMWLLRDVLLPVLWLEAWTGKSITWRGNDIPVKAAA